MSLESRVIEKFAIYGFTQSPLTMLEINELFRIGFDEDTIYQVGCDLYCTDMSLDEIIEEWRGVM